MDQTAIDRLAIETAIEAARQGEQEGGIPIGAALISPTGEIIASGHNRRVQSGDPTAHAEMVCMRNAGRRRDWHTLTMGTTLSPCVMCSGAAVLHRLKHIVIGENRTFGGREDWLRESGIEVELLNDQRCIEMMERFIRERPDLWNEDIGVPE